MCVFNPHFSGLSSYTRTTTHHHRHHHIFYHTRITSCVLSFSDMDMMTNVSNAVPCATPSILLHHHIAIIQITVAQKNAKPSLPTKTHLIFNLFKESCLFERVSSKSCRFNLVTNCQTCWIFFCWIGWRNTTLKNADRWYKISMHEKYI